MLRKILKVLLIIIVLLAAGGYLYYRFVLYVPPLISMEDRAQISLMPLPAKLELKGGKFVVDETFEINFIGYQDDLLDSAGVRFMNRLLDSTSILFSGDKTEMKGVVVHCANGMDGKVPTGKEDESYKLIIKKDEITLEANSPLGVLHGFETLLQLKKIEGNVPTFPTVEIEDGPRFPWRGIMIDVSRHWMPKQVILRNLNAMAAVKLNVMHLHLSDDQGFRVESKKFPLLHEIGSNGKYYTQEDVKEMVKYAANRGIRIVPEFDMPGHTKSWLMAYPEYAAAPGPFNFGISPTSDEIFSVPMDPSNEELYNFLDELIGEMSLLFPDPYFHIGGDEVNPKAWMENEEIREFMDENNLEDGHDLQAYFNTKMNSIVRNHGKTMVGWEEILHPDLATDVVVQAWKSQKTLFEAVQQGASGILSAGIYLDHKLHSDKHYLIDPLILPGAVDLEPDTAYWKMYDVKMDIRGNISQSQLVLFDRNPDNINGFFALLDQRMAFRDGILSEGELVFEFSGPMGTLTYKAELEGDSLFGHISLGPIKIESVGKMSGGSHIPGTLMPKIEVIKPLTDEEERRILGAEAAMWSEVVSNETIDSRIWPRSAAVAEKLWSPASLTGDIEDMYRRLPMISSHLSGQGSIHERQYEIMIRRLVKPEGYKSCKTLMDALEEVKYYNRMSMIFDQDFIYLPDMPLDHIADIARPESLLARDFNMLVNNFFDEPNDNTREEILEILKQWERNHDEIKLFINDSSRLNEIENVSFHFSRVAGEARRIMESGGAPLEDIKTDSLMATIAFLEFGENGVLVAVTPGLRQILTVGNNQ